MAAEVEKELGLRSEFEAGSGGIFEVRLDGALAFTNECSGGVPPGQRVIEALRGKLA